MAFQTSWLYEPYILVSEYSGDVIGSDFDTNMIELLGVVQAMPLYVLVDFQHAANVPMKILELSSPALLINHANLRWFVMVNPRAEHVVTTRLLTGTKIRRFQDRHSAESFLKSMVRVDLGVVLK
jgi:hypothetical protein